MLAESKALKGKREAGTFPLATELERKTFEKKKSYKMAANCIYFGGENLPICLKY